jgi:soluble lytic murein transglycosylase
MRLDWCLARCRHAGQPGLARSWKLAYPRPYAELVSAQAQKNALNASLIYAVMREESAFDPEAESPADAYGLMQLIIADCETDGPNHSVSRTIGLRSSGQASTFPSALGS